MSTDDDSLTAAIPLADAAPISEILKNLGLTREELLQHASQMHHFFEGEEGAQTRAALEAVIPILQQAQSSSSSTTLEDVDTRQYTLSMPQVSSRTYDSVATPPPQPRQIHGSQSTKRPSTVHIMDDSDDSNDLSDSPSKAKARGVNSERRARAVASPSRAKPSLDEIMQMHSRQSRRVSESEDSDDSSDDSFRVSDAFFPSYDSVFDA